MHAVRKVLLVTGTIAALSAPGLSVSAAAPSEPQDFLLTKTCASAVLCTVQTSSFAPIPTGTDITYTVNGDGSDGLAYPTITVQDGSTTGVCDWNQPGGPVLAKCTFTAGTGLLTRWNLAVDVTVAGDAADPASVWTWTGTYSFSTPSPQDFLLTKTCASAVLCTVQTSSFAPIPTGTDITYTVNGDGSDGLAYPTITVQDGSTTGVCDWNQPAGPVLAKCTFAAGTELLDQFNLAVDVTVVGDPNAPDSVWTWTGTYWFGNAD